MRAREFIIESNNIASAEQGVAEDRPIPKAESGKAVALSNLGKFHAGVDTLGKWVPERLTHQFALDPNKWEHTFYSLTLKEPKKIRYYRPKNVDIVPGTLVGDMAIANQFYRTKDPAEQEQYALAYLASLKPYPVNLDDYEFPELLIPRKEQGVAEGLQNIEIQDDKSIVTISIGGKERFVLQPATGHKLKSYGGRAYKYWTIYDIERKRDRFNPNIGMMSKNQAITYVNKIIKHEEDAAKEKPGVAESFGDTIPIVRQAKNAIRNIGVDKISPSVQLYRNPELKGAYIKSSKAIKDLPVTTVPISSLSMWEPESKLTGAEGREHVAQMVQAIKQGVKLPPITVTPLATGYRIVDGHHRYGAYKLAGVKNIPVRVVDRKKVLYVEKQGVAEDIVETVDVLAIHAEALREHLLSNPALYENREDFQEMRGFLDSHRTPTPLVKKSYVYASVQVTPMSGYANIAHFNTEHKLLKLDKQFAYFNIEGTVKRFPETGTLSGDSLSQIYFFKSKKELDHFDMLLKLKFSNYKQTSKILDKQGVAEDRKYIQSGQVSCAAVMEGPLNELFDGSKDWKWTYRDKNQAKAKFTVGDVDYTFSAEQDPDEAPGDWDVEFAATQPLASPSWGLTGTGNSAQVLGTVVEIMKSFITSKKSSIRRITFAAKEDSRQSLYVRVIKRLLPKWNLEQSGEEFVLTRPGGLVFWVYSVEAPYNKIPAVKVKANTAKEAEQIVLTTMTKFKGVDPMSMGASKNKPDLSENFADGRNPQDRGDSQRHGIPKGATMAELEKASKAQGRKGQLARWQLNMRRGKKK